MINGRRRDHGAERAHLEVRDTRFGFGLLAEAAVEGKHIKRERMNKIGGKPGSMCLPVLLICYISFLVFFKISPVLSSATGAV
jgi:hypothetical protein